MLAVLSMNASSDAIEVMMETGIPLGDWSSELKTGNSFGIIYSRDIIPKLKIFSGADILSYRTTADLYHVNIMHIPAGISYSFFQNGKLSMSMSPSVGLSIIERKYDEAQETGLNEFYALKLDISYMAAEKSYISLYTKYLSERFIDGKSYAGIGISVGFAF
ncbi:MAG: hypothetical protein AB7T10_06720 [bacterium]